MFRKHHWVAVLCLCLAVACDASDGDEDSGDATSASADMGLSDSESAPTMDATPVTADQGAPGPVDAATVDDAATIDDATGGDEPDSGMMNPDSATTADASDSSIMPVDASIPVEDGGGVPADGGPIVELDAGLVVELDAAPRPDLDAAPMIEPDVAQACPAGEVRCADDGRARLVCNADNQTSERVACADDEFCAEAACQPQVCPPDALACDGDQVRRCNELGDGFVDGEGEDCLARGLGCVNGECADAVAASRGVVCDTVACLARRTANLVCGRYRADLLEHSRRPYRGGANRCDPGTLTDDGYDEALRATNYGRWLAGVAPVVYDDALNPPAQACAAIMANQGNVDHNPPADWACYTEEGARAAAVSNIQVTFGGEPIPDTVVRFLWDEGPFNRRVVGHRRWMQSPTLGTIGFGYHEGRFTGDSAACLNVIGGAQVDATGPPFIAYPAPGPFPRELLKKGRDRLPWSVSVDSLFPEEWPATERWEVAVNRLGPDGPERLEVTDVSANAVWHGRTRAVVFSPDFNLDEGRYQIVVESGERRYAWETEIVRCDPP